MSEGLHLITLIIVLQLEVIWGWFWIINRSSNTSIKKSRMNREVHVRFCERFRGETPLYLLDCVSCVALGYEDIKVLWKGNITLLEMIGFMRVQKRATPRSVEDSQRIASKELDYRIGLSGVVFKPPWGADLKRIGIERQGQSSANVCMLSICMVWL